MLPITIQYQLSLIYFRDFVVGRIFKLHISGKQNREIRQAPSRSDKISIHMFIYLSEEDQSPKTPQSDADGLKSFKDKAGLVKVYCLVDVKQTRTGSGIITSGFERYTDASQSIAGLNILKMMGKVMLKLACFALMLLLLLPRETSAGEKSLYDFLWLDPDKKVYVLQNKLFKKEHTFYADLGYMVNFTSKFQNTHGFALRSGFYFHEEWAIEGFYNLYSNSANDEYRAVRSFNTEPFIRRLDSTYGAIAIWSPFYGKINTFNQIFYFDWSFGAGVAKINGSSNRRNAGLPTAETRFDPESFNGAILKSKLKFHVMEHVHLGIEYFNTYYMAPGPRQLGSQQDPAPKLRINTDIIMSVGLSY